VTSLEFRDRLARRARRANAYLTLAMLEPLEIYFRLLTQWNAKINLTALPLDVPTDETFDRLLIEPLAAARQVPDASNFWFDLGSGGGSPAIPLKIARPALRLTMIESKTRKAAFLREAVHAVGLAEVRVENDRFEEVALRAECVGVAQLVTARAVRADSELFHTAGQLLGPNGRLLLFRPSHSAEADPAGFTRLSTVRLTEAPSTYLSIYRRCSTWNNTSES
jgi:16S rRNA (guanine527-N7)-methyltransferase